MLFARIAFGASPEGRVRFFEQHKAYLKEWKGSIVQSGPLVDDKDNRIGALVVIEADSYEKAAEINSQDPFVANRVYASMQLVKWERTI